MGDRPKSNAHRGKLRPKSKPVVAALKPIVLYLVTERRSGDREEHRVTEVPTMHFAKLVRDRLRGLRIRGKV